MGDGARSSACSRFVAEFGEEIEKAQGESDGATVGVTENNTVAFMLETRTRHYVSESILFEPDAADEDNLNALCDAMLIEDGSKGSDDKRAALLGRMRKADLVASDFTE